MKKFYFLLFLFIALNSCQSDKKEFTNDFITSFERSGGLETATYLEVVEFYKQLAESYRSVSIYEMGNTDIGEPLHLVTFNPDRSFESEFSSDRDKNIRLINNGIHPGESDGIDASMMLFRDLALDKIETPKNTVIAVIPVYNIGGALNRNSHSRANQNGPIEYGFRGNARNFNLNRDFIKADTRNAQSFNEIFKTVRPQLFIDNHVSNGADYQYIISHLFTQHNKLGGDLGSYLNESFIPQLEDSLKLKNWEITPFVNIFNRTPDQGFSQFLDDPRYSTGYTALFNTLGMMIETHMLKPYKQRVEGTYELMRSFIGIADKDASLIKKYYTSNKELYRAGEEYPISWELDSTRKTTLNFKGYEAEMIPSKVTGMSRLKYDTTRPYTRPVSYYNFYKQKKTVTVPEYYVIPAGYWHVVQTLRSSGIRIDRFKKDTIINAEVYRIDSYETTRTAYEGHYPHYNTKVSTKKEEVAIKKGDYIARTDQNGLRYIIETLEPEATDSFFNWNFFDAILQQKEYFSPYVWEDKAFEILESNPNLKNEFEDKKKSDPTFSGNSYLQLDWIYKRSVYYENSHLRYPVVRVGG
jgi:hypothetical protein